MLDRGLEVIGVAADVRSADDVANLVGAAVEQHSRADVLVNNARHSGVTAETPVSSDTTRSAPTSTVRSWRLDPLTQRVKQGVCGPVAGPQRTRCPAAVARRLRSARPSLRRRSTPAGGLGSY